MPRQDDASLIEIAGAHLSATINPLGAELWSLTDRRGRHLMTDANPRWWTGRAPVLFPFVGRLRHDRYRLGDACYTMPKHGFARGLEFQPIEVSPSSALLRLAASEPTRRVYPFEFQLDLGFSIDDSTLAISATVTNAGAGDMPFALGFHPAFAWPLPFGASLTEHVVTFERPEPSLIRRVGSEPGLIAVERFASPVSGDTLIPTHELFRHDALIWDDLESRSLLWGPPEGTHVRVDFPDMPCLGIWQKPGAPHVCIEPWTSLADQMGFAGDVWEKPGIARLAPGDSRTFRLSITLMMGVKERASTCGARHQPGRTGAPLRLNADGQIHDEALRSIERKLGDQLGTQNLPSQAVVGSPLAQWAEARADELTIPTSPQNDSSVMRR